MTTSSDERVSTVRAKKSTSTILNKVAQTYATALFQFIQESAFSGAKGSENPLFNSVRSALEEIHHTLSGHRQLSDALNSPVVPTEKKVRLVEDLLKKISENSQESLNPLAVHFIGLLVGRGRLDQLPGILQSFDTQMDASRGIHRGVVQSAHPLSQEDLQGLQKSFEKKFGHQVILRSEINSQLMGGLVVQLGDLTFDGSVRSALKRLEATLERV